MTLAVWMLVLAVFLSGAVTGVFVMLVIGIHIGGRSHHLTDEPDAHLDALTRSTLGAGVRTNCPAGNRHAEGA
jgi:hypothetical protein